MTYVYSISNYVPYVSYSFSFLTFLFFQKKSRDFFVNFGNREAVKKHLVFMSIRASQIENVENVFEIYM